MKEFEVGDYIKCINPGYPTLYGSVLEVSEKTVVGGVASYWIRGAIGTFNLHQNHTKDFVLTPPLRMNEKQQFTAPDILRKAEEIMRERGKQYDQQGGERSMEKIVNTFNAATGHNLTEAQGWMFMIFLKLVRDNSRTEGHQDSCEDLVAYSSLYGESRLS